MTDSGNKAVFSVQVIIDLERIAYSDEAVTDTDIEKLYSEEFCGIQKFCGYFNFGKNNVRAYREQQYGIEIRDDMKEKSQIKKGGYVIIHANNDKFENVARLLIFNPYPYNAQLDIFINEKIFKEINPILGLYEFHILTSIAENILIHENVHSGKMKKPIINRIYSEGDGREPSLTDTFIFEFGDSDMACWWFRPRLVGIDRRK